MIYNEKHNYDKTTCISPVDGTTKQKHVVNMNNERKFSIHHCSFIKYIVISWRKENMQLKHTVTVLLVASMLQQVI